MKKLDTGFLGFPRLRLGYFCYLFKTVFEFSDFYSYVFKGSDSETECIISSYFLGLSTTIAFSFFQTKTDFSFLELFFLDKEDFVWELFRLVFNAKIILLKNKAKP